MKLIRNFGRLGKSLLIKAVGIQENYKEVIEEKYIDKSVCTGCMFYNEISQKQDIVQDYCNSYCQKHIKTKVKTIYHNERNKLHFDGFPAVKFRLSRLQLSQIVLYHFMGVDNNGVVKNISTIKIAQILNCTTKTIRNNNKALVDLGYIYLSQGSDKDKFNVILLDYKSYHLSQREKGTGYIVMPKSIISEIANIKSVNALRILIRQLLAYDNRNRVIGERRKATYTYREIKRFVPRNLGYKALLDKEIEQNKSVFKIEKHKKKIEFLLEDKFNGKLLREQMRKENEKIFEKYKEPLNLIDRDIVDLVNMSVSYGIELIKKAIRDVKEEYINTKQYIYNFGGLIRTFVEINLMEMTT